MRKFYDSYMTTYKVFYFKNNYKFQIFKKINTIFWFYNMKYDSYYDNFYSNYNAVDFISRQLNEY